MEAVSQIQIDATGLAAMAMTPPVIYPEATPTDGINRISDMFFQNDCVLVRGLLNPDKLAYFRQICESIYAQDDEKISTTAPDDEVWLRQYKNGWIWEDRLREATNHGLGYEDIVANKRLYDILRSIMGDKWQQTTSSQIRRMAARPMQSPWNSRTDYHLDAQWGVDHLFIVNVWVPFTRCGVDAPALEFLLTPAEYIRKYSGYDASIPLEPPGPGGISPRMDYRLFEDDKIKAHFHPDRFWKPEFMPGDVIMFSSWHAHRTTTLPTMTKNRISLEWRLRLDTFDTPLRPLSPETF